MQRSKENILTRITYFMGPLLLLTVIPSFISGGSIYKNYLSSNSIPEALGLDIATILCIPMLYWGHSLLGREQQKGWVVFLAAFIYIFYAYSIYAFGGIYNILFPVYVALVCLSFYGAITGFLSLDIKEFKARVSKSYPRTGAIAFLLISAGVLYSAWLFRTYEAFRQKDIAEGTVTMVLDMAILLPAFLVAAWWLWKKRDWGYAMGSILLLISLILGLSKLIALGQQILKGYEVPTGLLIFYALFTITAGILCIRYWGAVKEKRAWTIVVTRNVNAPLEFVWKEIHTFFDMGLPSVQIDKEMEGDPNNDNKGAIRRVRSGKYVFREELIGYEPYFSYSYRMLSGLPARDYVGTIAVTELDDERTTISWDVNYRFRFPFPGVMVKRSMKPVLQHMIDEMKKSLEKKFDRQEAVN